MAALPRDDLVAHLARTDAPVLLLDTCTILDVVRAPVLEQFGVHDIDAVHSLIGRATGESPRVSLVICEQVHQEFRENIDVVERQTRIKIEKATDCFGGIVKRMQALSLEDDIPDAVELSSLGFPKAGRDLAEVIVQMSTVITDHHDEIVKAYDRVKLARPPATRARQSVKDCVVTESYLRLAATLHTGGFSRNMVFATSNTNDYQQGHSSLHPELRAEFHSVCLEYSPSWSASRHELDRCRTPLSASNLQ